MRSINLGVIVKQQPTTTMTVVLPAPDPTATAMVAAGSDKPFVSIQRSDSPAGAQFEVKLPPGDYVLVADSTIRPGEAGIFTVTTDAEATFWSAAHPDPGTSPRPWQLSVGTVVALNDPKDPWPKPSPSPLPPSTAAILIQGSRILTTMNGLIDANAGRGADPTHPTPKVHALLIGIDRYEPGPGQGAAHYSDLQGCVTDILETEKVLRDKVADVEITLLLAPRAGGPGHERKIAPDNVPTYANIVAAWRRVTEAAGPDDIVYIQYSGHGGRVKTLFPDIRVRGIDESLVPCDINDGEHGRYLRDVEMALLLQRLADRGINTTVVLDSCHSGSFTRGDQAWPRTRADGLVDLEVRGSDVLGSAVASAEELIAVAQALETNVTGATWKLDSRGRMTSPITVIAACGPTEAAYEYVSEAGAIRGALTSFWLRALAQFRPGVKTTYRDAFARVLSGVRGMFTNQTPMLLGEPDRVVLGTEVLATRPALRVSEVQGDIVTIDAGASLQIDEGTTLAIVRVDQLPELVDLAGLVAVEVFDHTGTTALARRIPGTGNNAAIEVGDRAVLRSYPLRIQRGVWIQAPTPFAEALAAAIAADPTKLLRVSTTGVDFQVKIDPTSLVAEITLANGMALPHVPRTPVALPSAVTTIVGQLVHLARYSNMQAFSNDDPNAPLASLFSAELFNLERPDEHVTGVFGAAQGVSFGLRLTNRSSSPLIFYQLDLQPDWSIVLFDPDGGIVEAGKTVTPHLHGWVDDPLDQSSRDVITVLATREPVDASLLTLAAMGAPALLRGPRGDNDPPLQELMRILQDPLHAARNAAPDATPSTGWIVAQVEFETTRPPPDGGARAPADELLGNPAVRDALGGSLVGEELRGDFVAARAAAAASGLESIVVDAITGRAGAARRALAAIAAGPRTPAQRVAQRRLAVFVDARCFSDVPGGAGGSFDDVIGLWDQTGGPQPSDDLLQLTGAVSARELGLLDTLMGLGGTRGVLALTARAPAPSTDWLAPARAFFGERLRTPEGAEPRLWSTTWAALADAGLARYAGQCDAALALIRDERARCEATADTHSAALCWLAEGDLRACVIESPATLGLWLSGSSGSGIDNAGAPEAEALEDARVAAGELDAARAAFGAARDGFTAAGAVRAAATADLRLAGAAALANDLAEARSRASAAETQLAAVGDERGRWLARIHGVLADIAQGHTVDPKAVDEIGEWGAGDGDLAYALGLGTLLTHAGRRWWRRDGGYEQAVQCAKLAERLFQAAGAPLAAAQALGDQAAAHQAVHDRGAATNAAVRADELLESLGPRFVPALSIPARQILLQYRVWSLANTARDADSMERLAARIATRAAGLGADRISAARSVVDDVRSVVDDVRSMVDDVREQTSSLAPLYRAAALELDPAARDNDRDAAWQAAEAGVAAVAEPRRWFFESLLRAEHGDWAGAAELGARYGEADPTWGNPDPDPASDGATELARQAQRQRADLAFTLFVRYRDPARARVHLAKLQVLDGDDWWKVSDPAWQAVTHLGDLQLAEGDAAGALVSYAQGRDLLEHAGALLIDDSSKTAFADSGEAQRLYSHAAWAALAATPADPARAFDFLERGRARALADLVADVRVTVVGSDPIARWRRASARRDTVRARLGRALAAEVPNPERIAALRMDLDNSERDVTTLAEAARVQFPSRFAALDTRSSVASVAHVTERLAQGVLVIELSLVDDRVLGWAVTRAGIVPRLQREVNDRAIRRAALEFQRACSAPGRSLAAGEVLANELVMPFADEIRAASQVVFVVSGELARVPFHALPFDGEPLIARLAVSYAPSASLLGRLATVPVADLPILVVGAPSNMEVRDPDGVNPARPLRPLPGARSEAEAIGALVQESRVLIDDATAAEVAGELPKFRVVHLATHGIVDAQSPWRSAIMLANGDQLSVSDLMGLALNADLVVLSACSSGTGELTRGEEVLGLARGLLAAGARAVIVSLWDVYDVPTRALMVELHRLLQTRLTPAEALRAAQRYVQQLDPAIAQAQLTETTSGDVRRNGAPDGAPTPLPGYTHPACWAPFILVGV